MFINLVNIYSKIFKDTFAHIGGKLGDIPNQRRETVAREMINFLLKKYEYSGQTYKTRN